MKILWHGVPGEYNTGYGTQTKLFTKALKDAGHTVIISSIVNGCFGYNTQSGIPVVVNGPSAQMGNSMIAEHNRRIKPDLVISMFDTFVCRQREYEDLPWVAWTVVDSMPLHPRVKKISSVPKMLLAMSHFGQDVLKTAGFDSTYVPLALSKKDYYPLDKAKARAWIEKRSCRKLPKFFAIMVSANMSKPSRKNFHGAFAAWALLHKRVPDSLLYVHTELAGTMSNGEDLTELADMTGMGPEMLMFPDQYLYNQGAFDAEYMRNLYSAADVMLCSSLGEGFGLPIIEAQACGCPVIAPYATATAELLGPGSAAIRDMEPISLYGASQMFLPHHTTMALLLEAAAADATTSARPAKRKARAKWIHDQYDIKVVTKRHLLPALKQAMEQVRLKKRPDMPVRVGASTPLRPIDPKTVCPDLRHAGNCTGSLL